MRTLAERAANSPEATLLLATATVTPGADHGDRIRSLIGNLGDWNALIGLAHDHRMLPMLHASLAAHAADLVPDATRDDLHARFLDNTARNLALANELLALLRLLDAEGIRALPYKGPVLAQSLYGNLALRQMKDLDILVRPRDVARTIALLRERGYQLSETLLPVQVRLGLEYQYCLWRPEDEQMIELHWMIVPRNLTCAVGVDELWPRRIEVTLLHRATRSPSHEDTLAILYIHGSKHRWQRLEWIYGVAQLVQSKPIDWVRALDVAEEWHGGRMLRSGLLLAHDLLGATLPSEILTLARSDRRAVTLARTAAESLFRARDRGYDDTGFQLQLQERISDKLRYVVLRPMMRWTRRTARLMTRLGWAGA